MITEQGISLASLPRSKHPTLIIDALNVGGGATVLLDYLVEELYQAGIENFVMQKPNNPFLAENFPTARAVTQFSLNRYKILTQALQKFPNSNLLSFGNIPALLGQGIRRQFTYFHNALILPTTSKRNLPFNSQLRYLFLCMTLRLLREKTDYWIVQTDYYANALSTCFNISRDRIRVLPFYRTHSRNVHTHYSNGPAYDLLYVSSNSPHKNHTNLLKAMKVCASKGLFPNLAVTCNLDNSTEIRSLKMDCVSIGVRITELDGLSNDDCVALAQSARAIIYPSLVETIGLGLIEAGLLEKPILASESPWIREVIRPSISFDPVSPTSIANAIMEFMETTSMRKPELLIENQISQLIDFLST